MPRLATQSLAKHRHAQFAPLSAGSGLIEAQPGRSLLAMQSLAAPCDAVQRHALQRRLRLAALEAG